MGEVVCVRLARFSLAFGDGLDVELRMPIAEEASKQFSANQDLFRPGCAQVGSLPIPIFLLGFPFLTTVFSWSVVSSLPAAGLAVWSARLGN